MSYIKHAFNASVADVRGKRQRRLIHAQMTDSFGVNHEIVIRNVSNMGVGATMRGAPPSRGSTISFAIVQGMEIDGTICWVQGRAFGIKTDKPVDLGTLTEVIKQKHQLPRQEGQWEVGRLHQIQSRPGPLDPNKLRKI